MTIRQEILEGPVEHQAALLWLFKRYHMASQWPFVTRCYHERYGKQSYQTKRTWTPTTEGMVLFTHREDLEGNKC
jgi:hypothetical protein